MDKATYDALIQVGYKREYNTDELSQLTEHFLNLDDNAALEVFKDVSKGVGYVGEQRYIMNNTIRFHNTVAPKIVEIMKRLPKCSCCDGAVCHVCYEESK